MDEALVSILTMLMESGEDASPRGYRTKETLGYAFRLENPRARRIHIPERRWSEALAIGEFCWHTSGSDDVKFIAYYASKWADFAEGESIWGSCYGKKIFGTGPAGVSQWEGIRYILREDPSSRRAVLTLLPSAAPTNILRNDVACISTIQFLLRDSRLNCITTMRSNDVIWGTCYDVFLATMLQEMLALDLGVELGWYQHSCGSIHLYEDFFKMAQEIVAARSIPASEPMPPMADLYALPDFLKIEAGLRNGQPAAAASVHTLPSYWGELAEPLLGLAAKKYCQFDRDGVPAV